MEKIEKSQVLAMKEMGYGQSCYGIAPPTEYT
jgi:hypothetical protein